MKDRLAEAENKSTTCSVGLARLQSVTKEMFLKVEKTFVTHNEKFEEVISVLTKFSDLLSDEIDTV